MDETGDAELVTDAVATCPYCGQAVSVCLDPGNGAIQDYDEDCEVCCRPWRVHVRYDGTGCASVWLEAES